MNIKSALATIETLAFGKVNLLLLITNRCNSRCTICNHWSNPNKFNLPIEVIEKLLHSRIVNKNAILLEGGEPFMHPDIRKILSLFQGLNYKILTNGFMPEFTEELVETYKIPSVGVSLDGTRETYERIRGIDRYLKVIETIERLKDKTDLSVCFTICPQNTFEDYLHVKEVCDKNKVDLLLNIYCESEYSGRLVNKPIDIRYEKLGNVYVKKYNAWSRGEIRRNCLGMRYNCNIFPNGDVVLCQAKPNIILGNLYKNSLDEIWKNKKLPYCNDCWLACNRYLEAKF